MSNSFGKESPLRVAINAQLSPNSDFGGVKSVLIGLISALGKLDDGSEEFTIIGPWENTDWLHPYIGKNQHIIRGLRPPEERPFTHVPRQIRPLVKIINNKIYQYTNPPAGENHAQFSDGFYENLGCDLIHFPYQIYTLCALPSIFNPHDLQHLHFPQFFSPGEIHRREQIYSAGIHFAQVVVAGSQWIKDDIINNYHISQEKIQVIPWAPPTQALAKPTPELLEKVKTKYDLPMHFAFYPAMTWKHKNHIRLLDSLAFLRDQKGIKIDLICTGNLENSFWPKIEQHINDLELDKQVKFLGTIPFIELRAIYQLCQFLVVPTLFEAASGPIFEAWQEAAPVTCSAVTSLPEQVRDAALLFDPFSVEAIADAMERMFCDEELRNKLKNKGKQRLMDFSWERTAKAYRAIYRKVGRRPLSDEDRMILNWDWMRDPKPLKPEIS